MLPGFLYALLLFAQILDAMLAKYNLRRECPPMIGHIHTTPSGCPVLMTLALCLHFLLIRV
jgi:hypothetical protein